jgi:aminoglycoside 6-adenylyltransferase
MESNISIRTQMLDRIVELCHSRLDIRALALVGSNARDERTADEWSDIDLILIVENSDPYLHSTDWLQPISQPWLNTLERDAQGRIFEQRVLFQNGIDVDFIVLSNDQVLSLQKEPLVSIIARGFKLLLDKDGFFPCDLRHAAVKGQFQRPSQHHFSELVNDFWFHSIWSAKKLKRGEIWTAKSCCDIYMKRLLLTMIEWHAHELQGWDKETWYNGRFIEHWADGWVIESLATAFAHYDRDDIMLALMATMTLFDRIAKETAHKLAFHYHENEYQKVMDWLTS